MGVERTVRPWSVLLIAVATVAALGLSARYAGILERALQDEQEASRRAWQAQRANLERRSAQLARRVAIGDSIAKNRPRVAVQIHPKGERVLVRASDSVHADANEPDTVNTATVTINDTSYAVPVRVAEVVEQQRVELANADTLRAVADTTTRAIDLAVPAADSAIVALGKRPGFLVRALRATGVALCAGGGAAVGSAVAGVGGAAGGAVVGVAVCGLKR